MNVLEAANEIEDGSGYIGHVGLQWQVPKSSISLRERIPTNNSLKRNLPPEKLIFLNPQKTTGCTGTC